MPDIPPARVYPPPTSADAGGGGPCVVTVGNFDGVHLGHASIVERLVAMGQRLGVPAVAVTFDPHPAVVVGRGDPPPMLSTVSRRVQLLLGLGLARVFVQPTVPPLVALEAEAFYERQLRDSLSAVGIVEGADFRFGHRRGGDTALLERLCRRDGLAIEIVPPLELDGEPVSSSRIRRLVAAGEVAQAASLCVASYRISGQVVEGARRGRTLGFPTANLAGIATMLPAEGVYAAIASGPGLGSARLPAAVHIGPKPSFADESPSVEAHLVGFSGDLYGQTLDVDFLRRLRETRRFESVDALQTQLSSDTKQAVELAEDGGVSPGSCDAT